MLLLTDHRWRGGGGESFSYGIYRTARTLRKFVDLQHDINGDKRRKLYGPKISAETIYLRRSFQVIYASLRIVVIIRGNDVSGRNVKSGLE